jgi:hypothetical protein
MVANETSASASCWRGLDRGAILGEIARYSEHHRKRGRTGEGYGYFSKKDIPAKNPRILLASDKVWNPATLLLHGYFGFIGLLETTLGVPVKVFHAVRNPFDAIATMHLRSFPARSHALVLHALRRGLCDPRPARRLAVPGRAPRTPHRRARRLFPAVCRFFGLDCPGDYLDSCRKWRSQNLHVHDRNCLPGWEQARLATFALVSCNP